MIDGYYWCRYTDDGEFPNCDQTTFIALLEDGEWFIPGQAEAVFDKAKLEASIVMIVKRPDQ